MKKSIVFLVVLMVSICAFADNNKPSTTKTEKPNIRIEKKVAANKLTVKSSKTKKIVMAKKPAVKKNK